jgi:hypothetical protein
LHDENNHAAATAFASAVSAAIVTPSYFAGTATVLKATASTSAALTEFTLFNPIERANVDINVFSRPTTAKGSSSSSSNRSPLSNITHPGHGQNMAEVYVLDLPTKFGVSMKQSRTAAFSVFSHESQAPQKLGQATPSVTSEEISTAFSGAASCRTFEEPEEESSIGAECERKSAGGRETDYPPGTGGSPSAAGALFDHYHSWEISWESLFSESFFASQVEWVTAYMSFVKSRLAWKLEVAVRGPHNVDGSGGLRQLVSKMGALRRSFVDSRVETVAEELTFTSSPIDLVWSSWQWLLTVTLGQEEDSTVGLARRALSACVVGNHADAAAAAAAIFHGVGLFPPLSPSLSDQVEHSFHVALYPFLQAGYVLPYHAAFYTAEFEDNLASSSSSSLRQQPSSSSARHKKLVHCIALVS